MTSSHLTTLEDIAPLTLVCYLRFKNDWRYILSVFLFVMVVVAVAEYDHTVFGAQPDFKDH